MPQAGAVTYFCNDVQYITYRSRLKVEFVLVQECHCQPRKTQDALHEIDCSRQVANRGAFPAYKLEPQPTGDGAAEGDMDASMCRTIP